MLAPAGGGETFGTAAASCAFGRLNPAHNACRGFHMKARIITSLGASVCLLGFALVPATAHAKALDKCGGIFLTASSHCEFKPIQECMTTCSVTATEQVCAQKTFTACSSNCTASEMTTCTQTHTDSCMQQCETISSKSSHEVCVSQCTDSCTNDAVSKNRFGGDRHTCGRNCSHDCEARCESSRSDDQSTDCSTKCTSVVQNECTEEVTRDCVLSCQTENYTSCQTETVNTCNTSCQNKGGAIFCDGQFLEASDLQACADQLATEFSFNIDVDVNVKVNGNGTVTTTNDDGSKNTTKVSCAFSPETGAGGGMAIGALTMLGVLIGRRRRRG
jgi:hypothetical protein